MRVRGSWTSRREVRTLRNAPVQIFLCGTLEVLQQLGPSLSEDLLCALNLGLGGRNVITAKGPLITYDALDDDQLGI